MGRIRSNCWGTGSYFLWSLLQVAMKPMDGVLAHPLLGFDGEEKGGRDLNSITCAGGESRSEWFHDLLGLGFAISPECEDAAKSFETAIYINSRTSYVSRCRSASGDFGPFGPDTCRLNSNAILAQVCLSTPLERESGTLQEVYGVRWTRVEGLFRLNGSILQNGRQRSQQFHPQSCPWFLRSRGWKPAIDFFGVPLSRSSPWSELTEKAEPAWVGRSLNFSDRYHRRSSGTYLTRCSNQPSWLVTGDKSKISTMSPSILKQTWRIKAGERRKLPWIYGLSELCYWQHKVRTGARTKIDLIWTSSSVFWILLFSSWKKVHGTRVLLRHIASMFQKFWDSENDLDKLEWIWIQFFSFGIPVMGWQVGFIRGHRMEVNIGPLVFYCITQALSSISRR